MNGYIQAELLGVGRFVGHPGRESPTLLLFTRQFYGGIARV